jgi:prophage tail gpP-like protein
MIDVTINGEVFEGFTKISVMDSIDQLCNQFTMECTSTTGQSFVIPRGSSINIKIMGTDVLTGAVESVQGKYKSDEYQLSIAGRDNTRDVLKADLNPATVFQGGITLEQVIRKTLKESGISLEVINEVDDLEPFTKKEVVTDDVGSTIWDFWSQLADKRQVLITKDGFSRILITRPNQNVYITALRQLVDDPINNNNILEADWDFDDSDRRNQYNVYSQANFSVPREEEPDLTGQSIWEPEWVALANEPNQTVDPYLQNAENRGLPGTVCTARSFKGQRPTPGNGDKAVTD